MPDETAGAGVAVEETVAATATEDVSQVSESTEVETQVDETQATEETSSTETTETSKPVVKEEELPEFHGTVSARLKDLDKRAPGLAAHLQKFPQVRDAIAATFRREAAFRELYPGGLAEAQAIRDYFPRGEADVKEVLGQVEEVEALDGKFYTRDEQGNFPGHGEFIANLAAQDKDATISLLKRSPAEWAKLDPDSYHETMSGIIGRTLESDRVYEHMGILAEIAKEIKNPELSQRVAQLANYLDRFQAKKAVEPTEEQKRFKAEKEEFARQTANRNKEEGTRFHQSFVAEAVRFQRDLIGNHPLIKALPASLGPKKAKMVEEIRQRVVKHLDKIRPFKAAFMTAYNARDQKGVMEAQKNYWAPWLLNMYARKVLAEETPGLVTRPGTAGKPAAKPAARPGNGAPKKAYQGEDKRWYKPNGQPFSTQEVLRGAHLQS